MVTWLYKIAGQQMEAQIGNLKKTLHVLYLYFCQVGTFFVFCRINKITTLEQLKAVNISINTESDP